MPPIFPGAGFPLTGTVLDGQTHLPIGGATVQSGFGSTITDAQGKFSLYGGLGSHELSICRAGYVAITDGDVDPNGADTLQYELDPLFPDAGVQTKKFLELSGSVTGLVPNQPAQVFLGDQTVSATNTYQLDFAAAVPGNVYTTVLAWGNVTGTYNQDASSGVPFNYTNFHYEIGNWAMGNTIPASKKTHNLVSGATVPLVPTTVKYKNLGAFASVQTDILLDFGLVGSVPVARQTSSNQAIPVPQIQGLKYDVVGTATDSTGKLSSTVQLTTNDPAQATFQLLNVPKVLSPANGATGAGQRPTFSWTPDDSGQSTYEVTLYEEGEVKPKWIGHTSASEIQYPAFSQSDINGGALRSDKKYTWVLTATDVLGATDLPTSRDGPVPVKPYRVRERQAQNSGNGFNL